MRRTVLVVDDDEAHCYAMAKTLEIAGYKTKIAHSGGEALRFIAEQLPDAVLLDIGLHDIDGFEVCRRIRQRSESAGLPVVIHTASHASDVSRSRAEAVGVTDVLTYPVEREQLFAVLEGAISKGQRT